MTVLFRTLTREGTLERSFPTGADNGSFFVTIGSGSFIILPMTCHFVELYFRTIITAFSNNNESLNWHLLYRKTDVFILPPGQDRNAFTGNCSAHGTRQYWYGAAVYPGHRDWPGGPDWETGVGVSDLVRSYEIQNDPERSSTVIRKQEILKTRKKCAKNGHCCITKWYIGLWS